MPLIKVGAKIIVAVKPVFCQSAAAGCGLLGSIERAVLDARKLLEEWEPSTKNQPFPICAVSRKTQC